MCYSTLDTIILFEIQTQCLVERGKYEYTKKQLIYVTSRHYHITSRQNSRKDSI